MTFNPETDFFTVADKYPEIIGEEVTTTEPIIAMYYLTRWNRLIDGVREVTYDLSIQWVGQLL